MRSTLFTILAFLLISNANAGNTWQTATPLLPDNSVTGAQSDDEWYVITITGTQAIKRLLIDLTFTHADGNIDMTLHGDDFVNSVPAEIVPGLFRDSSAGSTTNDEFIDHDISASGVGDYYIQITGADQGNSYTLTWTELTDTDDSFEENDSSAATKAITEGVVIFGSQSDEDWYSIDVTSGNEHVLASLRFHNLGVFGPGDNIDLDLELLDDNGNSQQISNNSAAINEAIDFVVPAPGIYHVRVSGDNNGDGYALYWTDVTAPVIILTGSQTVSIVQGTAYVDAGATAQDNVDGDVSANIAVVSTVNVNTVGAYSVTYNVSDAAGNAATPVIRTVNVTAAATDGGSSGALAPASLLVLLLTGLLRRKRC
ncbi:MAG: DUF5011 domain-containing protein [Gammaproteobacteria bacterium]|nr:DUF5011 domain-containing protein [Gammaproteobacteria bacterium]